MPLFTVTRFPTGAIKSIEWEFVLPRTRTAFGDAVVWTGVLLIAEAFFRNI